MFGSQINGAFATAAKTAAIGTAFTQLVRPYRGASGGPATVCKLVSNQPNWYSLGFTHISQLVYESGATAHALTVLRPLNWATIDGAVAPNATTMKLKWDPGVYSTNYKYPLPGNLTKPAGVADNAIASGDFVAYQLTDGTWILDTVNGAPVGLTITLATAVPNVTGGGVADGQVLFFFGVPADLDPATGAAHMQFIPQVSVRTNVLTDGGHGTVCSYHPGDPMVVHSNNITAAGTLGTAAGFYADR